MRRAEKLSQENHGRHSTVCTLAIEEVLECATATAERSLQKHGVEGLEHEHPEFCEFGTRPPGAGPNSGYVLASREEIESLDLLRRAGGYDGRSGRGCADGEALVLQSGRTLGGQGAEANAGRRNIKATLQRRDSLSSRPPPPPPPPPHTGTLVRPPTPAEGQPCIAESLARGHSGPSQKDGQGCPWYRVPVRQFYRFAAVLQVLQVRSPTLTALSLLSRLLSHSHRTAPALNVTVIQKILPHAADEGLCRCVQRPPEVRLCLESSWPPVGSFLCSPS